MVAEWQQSVGVALSEREGLHCPGCRRRNRRSLGAARVTRSLPSSPSGMTAMTKGGPGTEELHAANRRLSARGDLRLLRRRGRLLLSKACGFVNGKPGWLAVVRPELECLTWNRWISVSRVLSPACGHWRRESLSFARSDDRSRWSRFSHAPPTPEIGGIDLVRFAA